MQLSQLERWHRGGAPWIQAMKLDARVIYVGFGRRVLAGLIDLAMVLTILATVVLVRLASEENPPRASALVEGLSELRASVPWIIAMVFSAQTIFWTLLGATPGMSLMGSQVLRAQSGRHLSLPRSFFRCIGLWMGLACLGVGVAWSIWDRRRQGLHDKLVGAVVVKEDESLMALEELSRAVE